MPAMISWPVSSLVKHLKVGSSSAKRWRPWDILSWSAFVFGSMAMLMTGSGKVGGSRAMSKSSLQRVSPVVMLRKPTKAAMSPE